MYPFRDFCPCKFEVIVSSVPANLKSSWILCLQIWSHRELCSYLVVICKWIRLGRRYHSWFPPKTHQNNRLQRIVFLQKSQHNSLQDSGWWPHNTRRLLTEQHHTRQHLTWKMWVYNTFWDRACHTLPRHIFPSNPLQPPPPWHRTIRPAPPGQKENLSMNFLLSYSKFPGKEIST